jgi:hypothetical protein
MGGTRRYWNWIAQMLLYDVKFPVCFERVIWCNPCILWVDLNRVYIGVAWCPIVELTLREGR